MIARITLILTLLLSMAHSPFCRCSVAAGENASELTAQASGCSNCCDHESNPVPCPARPDCCCRAGRMLMLADSHDSEFARESHPTGGELFCHHSSQTDRSIQSEDAPTSARPLIDSGGRALLMRTCRLRI